MSKTRIVKTDNGFAVEVDGEIVSCFFCNKALAASWASRRGLYKAAPTRKRTPRAIPEAIVADRIFGLPVYASLQNRPYARFFIEAKAGKWGTLIRMGARNLGIRWRDYQAAIAAREVKTTS